MTNLMPTLKRDATVPTLLRALSGQKALYVQILALARQQSGHVAIADENSLMAILAARSRLIEQVAPFDRDLQPYKGRWQQVLDGLLPEDRAPVAALLKEVQQLLGDILALDEIDKQSLERQKADIGSQIKRTITGAALHRAYGIKR